MPLGSPYPQAEKAALSLHGPSTSICCAYFSLPALPTTGVLCEPPEGRAVPKASPGRGETKRICVEWESREMALQWSKQDVEGARGESGVTEVQLRAACKSDDSVSRLAVPVTMVESFDLSLVLSFFVSKMDLTAMQCQKPMRQHEALYESHSSSIQLLGCFHGLENSKELWC